MSASASVRALELRGDGRVHPVVRTGRSPAAGQILVAPIVVGLCATDREIRDGEMVYFTNGMASYPIVSGHEWVGRVQEIGPGVTGIAPGDRVVGECSIGCGRCAVCRDGRYHMCPDRHETGLIGQDGGLSERMLFPARAAHLVPDEVPDDAAALVEPTAIAYNAVRRTGLAPDERLLIVGAGPIGILAMQVARAIVGCEVSVCDLSPARLALAERLGADRVLLGGDAGIADGQWDAVIEASGSAGGMATALAATRTEGRIVCVSLYGRPTIPVDLDRLVTNDIRIRGALGSPGVWPAVIELIATGRVTPAELVTSRFPFDAADAAFGLIGDPAEVKIVIDVTEESS